ncbi:MAG TPA: acyl-CoA dehydrogenase family protein [Blastocatellia bacterium]|nr:acyl-CoA dehydrogenase family protein [Blastocatellia bacterium]
MEFDLTETQKLFQRSARELFAQELPSVLARETTDSSAPHGENIWRHLVDQGWTGLIFPEDFGGLGLQMVDLCVAFEEMGRALVPGPFLSTVAFAGSLIYKAGSDAQKEKYLKQIAGGQSKATVALLEQSASWNAEETGDLKLEASADTGDGLRLNGKKLFVTDAADAQLIVTAARSGGDLVLAIVPRDSAGLSLNPMPSVDTLRPLYEVVFENTLVPPSAILAKGERAAQALAWAKDVATLALAAEMTGGMQWVLDATVEYAKTRKQFGKAIGQFQAVQHHCANILLMTESTRSAVYYAAWTLDARPAEAPLAVSVAKAYASDSFREVGNLGIQVHGGIGFTWDHEIHFYYKRAKAAELMFGDATYHRERIAKLIVDRASKPVKAAGRTGN